MLHHRTLDPAEKPLMSPAEMPTDFAATGPGRIGAELRARRQARGWTMAQIAAALCLRESYVEAIEAGRPHDLPGGAYAVGFLRSYARLLDMDADALAQRYRQLAGTVRQPDLTFLTPAPDRSAPGGLALLLGLAMLTAAYTAWFALGEQNRSTVMAVPPMPAHLAELAQAGHGTMSPQVASLLPVSRPVPGADGPRLPAQTAYAQPPYAQGWAGLPMLNSTARAVSQ